MKILGIARSERFSPNSARRDEAVFRAVADVLRASGHEVKTVSEDGFTGPRPAAPVPEETSPESISEIFDTQLSATGPMEAKTNIGIGKTNIGIVSAKIGQADAGRPALVRACRESDAVFSMARDATLLSWLAAEERQGCKVINSAAALLRADRTALTRLFVRQGIPVPRTCAAADAPSRLSGPLWLKRGDACAQEATDVCHVRNRAEFEAALRAFAGRGISDVLACEHAAGDLVKFYGVEGTDFFFHYHATGGDHFSKFGLERFNGAPAGYDFRPADLKACADRAARLSGLTVYGGDCVVRPDGTFVIIDFNDWPSFSLCCDAAAAAIARRIIQ